MMVSGDVQVVQQLWDEWQLRFLVLLSLSIQYILLLCCSLDRKLHLPVLLKLCIRIPYIASDAVPINALAAILNRQKKALHSTPVRGNLDLELLWAPILLMHIGGSSAVPVQNMEESEQWTKHLTTAVSQVSIALYVFYSSWPSSSADKRQLAAAILIFIPGILKCFVKPWSVKSASFSSLQQARPPNLRNRDTHQIDHTEEYVRAARHLVTEAMDSDRPPSLGNEHILHSFDSERLQPMFRALCIDHTYPSNDRLEILKSFLLLSDREVCSAVASGLSQIYNLFYTKHDKASRYMQILNITLPLAAILLVHISLGEAYSSPQDVRVTYALLYGTLVLEIVSFIYWIIWVQSTRQHLLRLSQRNLISHFSSRRRHTILFRVVRFFGWEQYWNMCFTLLSVQMTTLVSAYLKAGWKEYTTDVATFRQFNDNQGELTLAREGCGVLKQWILGRPFDERILLWHLATDLCFYLQMAQHDLWSSSELQCAIMSSRQISNYMVHLLFANPEMLMVGSRRELFMIAYQELEVMFRDGYKYRDEEELRRIIVDKVDSSEDSEQGFLWEACALTKTLMTIDNGESLWPIIQGVWVEMLCFSASRCRGYLHAKNIYVEWLPQVWLLLAYAGMETLPERNQRTNFKGSEEGTQAINFQGESSPSGTEFIV